ncbi:MAG TPA: hypothetical protein PKE26_08040 [Kiritimatiellia bacterium]|nr:hypothetical protein [Kiritimatiellia bacterium]HMO99043.1 hypothetical protein [Kiritimatiellia bacterium]HMP96119.1 hypothetical protein [Kiritimatiellia bacterium]
MKMRHNVLIAAIAIFAAGCGKSPAPTTIATDSAATPTQLTSVFRAVTASGTILPIPELRTHVSPGDTVILEAKVMGTITPFVDNRALFVVGDEGTLTSCDLRGDDDHCKTPWDNCCDDPRDLRAGTATIQIVDAEGQVLKHGIRGVNGLKELSRVRVEGVVAPQSTGTALIINATGIEML